MLALLVELKPLLRPSPLGSLSLAHLTAQSMTPGQTTDGLASSDQKLLQCVQLSRIQPPVRMPYRIVDYLLLVGLV